MNQKLPLRPALKYISEWAKGRPIVGAEVGVFQGDNALSMLENIPNLTKLYLIDPYEEYPECHYSLEIPLEEAKPTAIKRLKEFENRIQWVFRKFEDAEIEETLDFIYIDANHSYEFVCKDLHLAEQLVKRGGIIAGHDYYNKVKKYYDYAKKEWLYKYNEVKKAVDEFCKERNLKLNIGNDEKEFWFKNRVPLRNLLLDAVKVCIVSHEYPPDIGGVGISVKRTNLLLKELGYNTSVVILRTSVDDFILSIDNYTEWEEEKNILLPMNLSVERQAAFVNAFFTAYLKYHDVKLLQYFYLDNYTLAAAKSAKSIGIPVILSARGNDEVEHVEFIPNNLIRLRYLLEAGDEITFVNYNMLNKARELGLPENKGRVIYNSFYPKLYQFTGTPKTISKEPKIVIGTVGNLAYKKGIKIIVEALKETVKSSSVKIKLLLVGPISERELENIRQQITSFSTDFEIEFTGACEHSRILTLFQEIDIFVLASVVEGCSNAMLEAMYAGCALVLTKIGIVEEVFQDGLDALLISPYSVKELSQTILSLIKDDKLRERISQNAKLLLNKVFNYEIEKNKLKILYEDVLKKDNR